MNQAMNRNRSASLDLEVDRALAALGQRLQLVRPRMPLTLSRTSRHTSRIAQASPRGQGVEPPSSRHSTGM